MKNCFERYTKAILNRFGFDIMKISTKKKLLHDPVLHFSLYPYLRFNQRRLEHLLSLNLSIGGATVLEVGAGIGDHTSFFIDRGCQVTASEPRQENIEILRSRYPKITTLQLDLDNPPQESNELFDIVYCYGVLYHTKNPAKALEFMSSCCKRMLLLSTCVSFGHDDLLNPCIEDVMQPMQSVSGVGSRPARKWIYNRLKKHFKYVYLPLTQPNHKAFPIDWSLPEPKRSKIGRAVFIASREKINNELLTEEIPLRQRRGG